MSDLVGNPHYWIPHVKARLSLDISQVYVLRYLKPFPIPFQPDNVQTRLYNHRRKKKAIQEIEMECLPFLGS